MLFFNFKISKQNKKRKEKDSFLAHKYMSYISVITPDRKHSVSPKHYGERASLYTSLRKVKGSITIEASLAVPLFFLATLCVIYLMEMMALQMSVRIGMHTALEQIVGETTTLATIGTDGIEEMVVAAIGEEKLEQSILLNGKDGLDCSESKVSLSNGCVTLHVNYTLQLPIPQFGNLGLTYEEEMVGKAWTGYDGGVNVEEEIMVYISDTESVYHLSSSCTHLQLEIYGTTMEEVVNLRNEYGEMYTPCSKCIEAEEALSGVIYVASTGTHYHSNLSCSGLKRSIYEVPISEVIGMGLCSRCAEQ